jgi:hypothetical protein
MGGVMNQLPDWLYILGFSQEVALGVGECDGYPHGAAIRLEYFPPGFEIKQIEPHLGRQLHYFVFTRRAATVGNGHWTWR